MSKTIHTAVYKTPTEAAGALTALEAHGFTDKQISVLMSDSVGEQFKLETGSKLPEGTAIGAGTGGALGALIAGLTTIGALATGGVGILVAGPLVAALAGAGAGSATGGVIGALVGYGISEHEAKLFAEKSEDGEALVAVECVNDDACDRAKEILEETGGTQVATS